ncbi:MAG: hypothetical protein ACKPKO_26150, partial [Candidatus Fonsibacter sp.]
ANLARTLRAQAHDILEEHGPKVMTLQQMGNIRATSQAASVAARSSSRKKGFPSIKKQSTADSSGCTIDASATKEGTSDYPATCATVYEWTGGVGCRVVSHRFGRIHSLA